MQCLQGKAGNQVFSMTKFRLYLAERCLSWALSLTPQDTHQHALLAEALGWYLAHLEEETWAWQEEQVDD